MYEILTGTLPFTSASAEELAHLHLEAKPIPPSEYIPDIPKALEEIILKVLAKEPSARYRTADQLGRVLMKFGTQRELTEAAAPAPLPRDEPVPDFAFETSLQPDLTVAAPAEPPLNIDWVSVGLGLLALIAVGGLIPFWMWIYFVYNPPIK
jgi:serine/threonine-protein kinase